MWQPCTAGLIEHCSRLPQQCGRLPRPIPCLPLPPSQMAVVDPKKPHTPWLRTFDADVAPFHFIMPGSSRRGSSSGGSEKSSSSGGSSGGATA